MKQIIHYILVKFALILPNIRLTLTMSIYCLIKATNQKIDDSNIRAKLFSIYAVSKREREREEILD